MLDRLTPAVRHAALILLVTFLTAVQQQLAVLGIPEQVAPVVGAAITVALAWLTPLTRKYGVGKEAP